MPDIEAILTCPDCGDVAELTREPAENEGVFVNRIRKLNPTRCGLEPNKCPKVARKKDG